MRHSRSCLMCGETFNPVRYDAMCCSARCRQRKHRAENNPLNDTTHVTNQALITFWRDNPTHRDVIPDHEVLEIVAEFLERYPKIARKHRAWLLKNDPRAYYKRNPKWR